MTAKHFAMRYSTNGATQSRCISPLFSTLLLLLFKAGIKLAPMVPTYPSLRLSVSPTMVLYAKLLGTAKAMLGLLVSLMLVPTLLLRSCEFHHFYLAAANLTNQQCRLDI